MLMLVQISYCISNLHIKNGTLSNKIDLGIKCSMVFVSLILLQNRLFGHLVDIICILDLVLVLKHHLDFLIRVGIMDSGYRGNVYCVLDNIDHKNQFSDSEYSVEVGNRLVQICAPNITYPTVINIVSSDVDLDIPQTNNQRGTGGFGSTGR